MKSLPILLALLISSGAASAFPGTIDLQRIEGPVKRSLSISNWHVDKRGVPSFDFAFSQAGGGCEYQRKGHAIAGFDEADGHVELEIYAGEDDHGKEGPRMMIFYANNNDVVLSMPVQQNKVSSVTFEDKLMRNTVAKKCGYTERGTSIELRK
jgi:hypothetical protein